MYGERGESASKSDVDTDPVNEAGGPESEVGVGMNECCIGMEDCAKLANPVLICGMKMENIGRDSAC